MTKFTTNKTQNNPELSANFLSNEFLYYLGPRILNIGIHRDLQDSDIWSIHPNLESKIVEEKFWKIYLKNRTAGKSLLSSIFETIGRWKIFLTGFLSLISFGSVIVSPLLLGTYLDYLSLDVNTRSSAIGWMFCGIFFGLPIIGSYAKVKNARIMNRIGVEIRNAITVAIYKKSLVLSNKSSNETTIGEITNLMSADAQIFIEDLTIIHMLWLGPIIIAVCLTLLSILLGFGPTIVGLIILLFIFPINFKTASALGAVTKERISTVDIRIKKVNELLGSIKLIKLYSWESSFIKVIEGYRAIEEKLLKRVYILNGVFGLAAQLSPLFLLAGVYAVYALIGNPMNAPIIFTSLALFNALRLPLFSLFGILGLYSRLKVSLVRIDKYLSLEETAPLPHSISSTDSVIDSEAKSALSSVGSLYFKDATFQWAIAKKKKEEKEGGDEKQSNENDENDENGENGDRFKLDSLSFTIPPGSLTLVIGSVASGKSSLLNSIIGEIPKQSGSAYVYGRLSFCSQSAWIQNLSIRDNITFGEKYDADKFAAVCQASALEEDFKILPAGVETEIGERGITLSGGQKARVALARAMYVDADIYIFDDVLAAVDSHVAEHIFKFAISGYLKNKTRIFVTNALQFLPQADDIIMLKSGSILKRGDYHSMLDSQEFKELVDTYGVEENANGTQESDKIVGKDLMTEDVTHDELVAKANEVYDPNTPSSSNDQHQVDNAKPNSKTFVNAAKVKDGHLVDAETKESGSVGLSVYKRFIASSGNYVGGIALFSMFILDQVLGVGSQAWLAFWTTDPTSTNNPVEFYILVLVGIVIANTLVIAFRNYVFAILSARSVGKIHHDLLTSIAGQPQSFFDTTPLGRVVNRFTKDVDAMDSELPNRLLFFALGFLILIGFFVTIASVEPWMLTGIFVLIIVYRSYSKYFLASSRELARLLSIRRSPIFAHFAETLYGLVSIRAFGRQSIFLTTNSKYLDDESSLHLIIRDLSNWLDLRLDFFSAALVAGLIALINATNPDGGFAGLAVLYALSLTGFLGRQTQSITDVENRMNSVERIFEYSALPAEGRLVPVDQQITAPTDWPQKGHLAFNSVRIKYRPELDDVIHDLSFDVPPQCKVGVCGRTGSGKSTLTLALFRIMELAGGSITIDDIDISKLSLHGLRSKIAIIPQDPILFGGNVRFNLDPVGEYADGQVLEALSSVGLTSISLNDPVSENGSNFSIGQRQLFCVARAILRNPKILILDEASASMDVETDNALQIMIREKFKSATVLTIAHRLSTIMDSDKILVLNAGRLVEYDSPANLLKNPNGEFSAMIHAGGEANASHLISLVK